MKQKKSKKRPHNDDAKKKKQRPLSSRAVLALTEAELRQVEADLEHRERLRIGSRSEVLVLSALNKKLAAIDTEGSLAMFDVIDADHNGFLTRRELSEALRTKVEVRRYVRETKNNTLKNLLRPSHFDKVFDTLDASENGVITKQDFVKFVRGMALERARYLRVVALLRQTCFSGRGPDPDDDDDQDDQQPPEQCTPRGFWADFWYYVKNYHPLLALFSRDEAHPLSRRDVFCAELVKQCYCLVASVFVDRAERSWWTVEGFLYNWLLAALFVSSPSMVLEEVLFYCLACPCLRFERRGRQREPLFAVAEQTGDVLGRGLVVFPLALAAVAVLVYAIFVLSRSPDRHARFAFVWGIGLVSEYLITWPLLHLAVHFNFCLPDCDALPYPRCFSCCGLWHWLNCGRWATERRAALRKALDEDLEGGFFDDVVL